MKRVLSPEWVVTGREDALLDNRLRGGWGISPAPLQRGASFTDFGNSEIAVPQGNSPEEKAVQLHELLHASLSPVEVPSELLEHMGLTTQAVRMAEEARINLVGRYIGYAHDGQSGDTENLRDGSELSLANEAVKNKKWNDALNLYMTTLNTEAHKKVKSKLSTIPEWKEAFIEIDKTLRDSGYVWKYRNKVMFQASRHVQRNARDTEPVVYGWVDKTRTERKTVFTHGFRSATLPLAALIDTWLISPPGQQEGKKVSVPGKQPEFENVPQSARWENMIIGSTQLTEATTAFLGRRKRPSMTGKQPSRPDRLLTDPERRIFRETVKTMGGVVLFDCSGSMRVTHDVVREAVKQFSGATVMVYSHNYGGRENAWVVARNGRMVSRTVFDDLPLHSGNGIDGLALRWALSQRKNRRDFVMWVSDGEVTGKGDHQTVDLLTECAELIDRNNIVNVDSCEEALEVLAQIKRGGKSPKKRFGNTMTRAISVVKERKK